MDTLAFGLALLFTFFAVNKTLSALTLQDEDTQGWVFRMGFSLSAIACWTWYHYLTH